MSDAAAVHARYEAFASGFLLPLLRGGPTLVDRALPPGMLAHFAAARPADLEVDRGIYDALHAAASEVAPVRRLPYPNTGLMAVAMAAHDLLLVTDPSLDRAFARAARPTLLEWVDALLEAAGSPRTRGEALVRHPVVDRVLSLAREDVVVRNWASTYRFYGRAVPWNVVAAPRLRRVREERTRTPVRALLASLPHGAELGAERRFARLLAASPLTHLLRFADAGAPPLGGAALGLLGDASLRGGVARALHARGVAHVAEPLGTLLEDLYTGGAPPALLFAAVSLALELALLDALGPPSEAPAPRPRAPGALVFEAVVAELLRAPGPFGPQLELPPHDAQRLGDRVARERAHLPAVTLSSARALLDHAGREPASAPTPEAHP